MATPARAVTAALVISALAVLVQCARNPGPDEPETAMPAAAAPDGITRAAVEMIGMAAAHGVGSDDLAGAGVLERGLG